LRRQRDIYLALVAMIMVAIVAVLVSRRAAGAGMR
jgi:hypothetical protein